MVEAIIEKGGDHSIALKGNQDSLRSDARDCLAKGKKQHPAAKTEAKGHAEYLECPGLKAFGCIEATRVIDSRTESDIRIFVLSACCRRRHFGNGRRSLLARQSR